MKAFSIITLITVAFFHACATKKVPFSADDIALVTEVFAENQKLHEGLLLDPPKLDFKSFETSIDSLAKSKDERILQWHKSLLIPFPKNTKDLDSTLEGMAAIALILIEMRKEIPLPVEYNKFYCPMVERYWVSTDTTVRNPYASEMRDCGEQIKEE